MQLQNYLAYLIIVTHRAHFDLTCRLHHKPSTTICECVYTGQHVSEVQLRYDRLGSICGKAAVPLAHDSTSCLILREGSKAFLYTCDLS